MARKLKQLCAIVLCLNRDIDRLIDLGAIWTSNLIILLWNVLFVEEVN